VYYSFLKGEGKERRDELGNFASYRKQPHRGSDWGFKNGSEGKPVYAVAAGVVADNFWTDALGHCLIVKNDHDQVYVLVAHLQEKSPCKKGDKVDNSTVIGKIGNTGSASVGAHLHAAASLSPKPHLASFPALLDLFKLMDADKAKRDALKPKVEKPKADTPVKKTAAKKPAAKKVAK